VDITCFGFSTDEPGVYQYENNGKPEYLVVDTQITTIYSKDTTVTIPLSKLLEAVKNTATILLTGAGEKLSEQATLYKINKYMIQIANSKNSNVNAYHSLMAITHKYVEKLSTACANQTTVTQIRKVQYNFTHLEETWLEWCKRNWLLLTGAATVSVASLTGLAAFIKTNVDLGLLSAAALTSGAAMLPYVAAAIAAGLLITAVGKFAAQPSIEPPKKQIAPLTRPRITSTCTGIINTSKLTPASLTDSKCTLKDDNGLNIFIPNYAAQSVITRKFKCTCTKPENTERQMIPLTEDIVALHKPMLYGPCLCNNIASLVRMMEPMPPAQPQVLTKFDNFVTNIFQEELSRVFEEFEPCRNQWFNHLTAKKQEEVAQYVLVDDILIDHESLGNRAHIYENFVKTEKQFIVDGEKPKTRCICSPSAYTKYVCGPIVLELERNFKNNFFGYKVPGNWDKMEEELLMLENSGFKHTLQLDGSGFDLTQSFKLKQIVDWKIYEQTKDYELHTAYENFEKIFKRDKRIIKCMVRQHGKSKEYGTIEVSGKTFSGSSDTTLMNTIRMIMYNRYVNEYLARLEPYGDYWLWVKGDDVVCFYKSEEQMIIARNHYDSVFTHKGNTQPHGLGQIAKFYKVGDLEDIDFCSVNVIKTLENKYKVIRSIKSIATKENYSVKAAKYTEQQLQDYHQAIITSINKWIGGDNMLRQYYECIHLHNIETRSSWLDHFGSLLKSKNKKT
jgi:hypothetical protein